MSQIDEMLPHGRVFAHNRQDERSERRNTCKEGASREEPTEEGVQSRRERGMRQSERAGTGEGA
eukprot:3334189-Pleurochrysis_carterae.AAC.1